MDQPFTVHPSCKIQISYFSLWLYLLCASTFFSSDKDRFVTGSKSGHVTIWTNSGPISKKVFNNSEQKKSATRVVYANNKIYTLGLQEAQLTVMDVNLEVIKVIDHEFGSSIWELAASEKYVAVGEIQGNVTVFDDSGNVVLVSHF